MCCFLVVAAERTKQVHVSMVSKLQKSNNVDEDFEDSESKRREIYLWGRVVTAAAETEKILANKSRRKNCGSMRISM